MLTNRQIFLSFDPKTFLQKVVFIVQIQLCDLKLTSLWIEKLVFEQFSICDFFESIISWQLVKNRQQFSNKIHQNLFTNQQKRQTFSF